MTDLTNRIAEVLRDELAESFKYSLRFGRKWIDTGPEAVDVEGWAAHVAERITEALHLTEESGAWLALGTRAIVGWIPIEDPL